MQMQQLEEDTASTNNFKIPRRGSSSTDTMDNQKTVLVAVVVIACCAIVAVVLAAVALTNSNKDNPSINLNTSPSGGGSASTPLVINTGGAGSSAAGGATTAGGSRIYSIAIGHDWGAHEYLDEEGYISGFSKDLITEVCTAAGIDCRVVWDKYTHCIDSDPGEHTNGGRGLMDRWYDGCLGWDISVNRIQIFQFGIPYLNVPAQAFFVKKGVAFDGKDIRNKKIGFIDGWVWDEKCIARQTAITGRQLNPSTQVFHYPRPESAITALLNGVVDALSGSEEAYFKWVASNEIEPKGDFRCELGGGTMMARKDSDFISVWNEGFRKIQSNGKFAKICAEANDKHGENGQVQCV